MTLLTDVPDDEDDGVDMALAGTVPAPRPAPTGNTNGTNGANGNGHRPQPRPRHARNGRPAEPNPAEQAPADQAQAAPHGPATQGGQGIPGPAKPGLARRTSARQAPAPQAPAEDAPAEQVVAEQVAVEPAPAEQLTGGVEQVSAPPAAAPVARGTNHPPAKPVLGARPGLPTRKRQSHVAPELRDAPDTEEKAGPETAAIETFTVADDAAAQRARSRMAAFQRGTAGGRADLDHS
jgi:hypothetical protein